MNIAKVTAVSLGRHFKVKLDEKVLEEVEQNAVYLRGKVAKGLVIYGINTGFGGSANVRSSDIEGVQKALIRLVNAGMGRVFPCHLVRAAMVTRANCLARAYSGVRLETLCLLTELVNHDIMPMVPIRGSVSASGDLMPNSYIAATMMGRKDLKVIKDGKEMACTDALKEANLAPVTFGPKEGLAIINSTSFTAAMAAVALYDVNLLVLLTQVCTGLAVEALNGRTESFHPLVSACLYHKGQEEVAKNILHIIRGSSLADFTLEMDKEDKYGKLKQDRYHLRCSSQWLSPVLETVSEACRCITVDLNSSADNPIIDHRTDTIVHCGNFQGVMLSVAMDRTRQALGICGKLLFAQFSEIVDDKFNHGLPPNLSGSDINLDFGFKGADIAMASYMSELDHCVNPMSNHVLSAEMHNQSVNSMALVSTRLTMDAIEILQIMVANIICLLTQALDLRHLQFLVLNELKPLVHPRDLKAIEECAWYKCAFGQRAHSGEVCSLDDFNIPTEIHDRFREIYKSVCSGKSSVANSLGKGKFFKHM